jgi:hypothetical protein
MPKKKQGAAMTDTEDQAPHLSPQVVVPDERSNGQHAEPTPVLSFGVVEHEEAWVPVAEEYPGLTFYLWKNPPKKLRAQVFDAATDADMYKAVCRIALKHNGWRVRNEEGEIVELPPMNTPEFWEECPNPLAVTTMVRIRNETASLPNSLLPKEMRQTSASG